VKGTVFIAAAVIATAATVTAQDAAPGADAPRRNQVRMMENVLTSAVRQGAESLARRMQVSEPGSLIVTGTARARGIVLDGYGVFFDVDVPMMKQSVVWSMQTLERERQRAALRQLIETSPDSPARRLAEQQLRMLDRSPGSTLPLAPPAAAGGIAVAATVNEERVHEAVAPEPKDPNEQYTEAVKAALVDAMLDYAGLPIGGDEWLIVAARDSEGPITPGALDDASTIVLKVKGSDLLAYRSNKLTKEEARKRVEVREN
jgi:hypothetical protein